MNKIVSTDFITDDVQRLVPVDATATTPKNAAVAKLMKAWEAKTTQRAAKATGFTLMAVSLAACNDDNTTTTTTPTTPTTPVTPAGQTFPLTLDIAGTTGTVTLSGSVVDQLNVNVDLGASDLSVVSGQVVTMTVDQATASDVIVGTAANAATNTVTLNLNDENPASGAVDLADLTITQAKTVTVNAGLDVNANSAATNLTSLAATANDATLTVNTGANDLTITTGITAGVTGNLGTVAITGSGDVNHAAIAVAANSFDASALTGSVVGTGVITGAVTSFSTGSGNDTVLLGTNTLTSVSTGAGTDNVTLFAGDYGDKLVTIDGGTGSDTLTFVNGAILTDLASGSALSGFETIVFNATSATQAIDASLLNDQTYAVQASATGATGSVIVDINSTDTDIDLSSLVESTATATSMAAMTFVANASANTSAITYTGATAALNTITGSASAGDVLTGGSYADTFVVTDDGLLFNASNVMLDTFVGGASATSTYDTFSVGTDGTAFTVVAADSWAGSTGVEAINAVDNSSAISLTLGTTAETAGISRISLAADVDATGANVVNVAAYTATGVTIVGSAGVDTITGGAGADTITGGAGADVLSGGAGIDTFVFALDGDLFATGNTLVDTSIAGGDGTDVLLIGTTGTAVEITADDAFTGITAVESVVAAANTAAVTITLDGTAFTAGITTVDISAGTAATGNVINAAEITGSLEADMTLIGSATGVTTITGGAGDDTITGGTAGDVIIGGAGGDIINVGTGTGVDIVRITAVNQTAEWSDQTASTVVATTGMDVVTGLNAGDDISLAMYTGTAATTAADAVFDSDSITFAADLSVAVANNSAKFIRGDYSANTFTESSTGADVLMAFDADATDAGQDYEAMILIGLGGNTFALDAGTGGVISIM